MIGQLGVSLLFGWAEIASSCNLHVQSPSSKDITALVNRAIAVRDYGCMSLLSVLYLEVLKT